jgi:hypothetical protein
MQIIRAASDCAYSSLLDIALAAAMTPDLFSMQSLPAVNAVLSALGKAAFVGLDLPSLKAANFWQMPLPNVQSGGVRRAVAERRRIYFEAVERCRL